MSFKLDFRASLEGDTEIKRKFEDLTKALEDTKTAAEDAEKPLDDMGQTLEDVSKSAGDMDKDLDSTAKTLDDVSKSAGDINKDLDDVSKSFDDISKSAVDVSGDLKDADSAFSDIASNADGAVSSMDAVKSSFDGISDSAVEADQNIAAATTGLEGVGTATESAAAGADSLATSLDNIAASAQEAETNISAAANGIDGIGTSIGQAETALDGLGSAFDGAGTATTTFNDVLTSTGTQAQAASGGLTPLNTVLGQVGGATQQAQGGFQGFNSSLGIMTGFIGTAASGAIQFVSALNNLHGAQIKVDATQAKLSTTSEAVAKAQAKLNDLYSSGSASAEQISQATLDLQQATEKNSIAIERAGKAQDDLNIKYAKFATDVLPGLIQSITSTVAVASQLHDKFSGTQTSGLINFFTEGETGAKGFASALAVLALSAGTAWAALELYKQLPSITSAWTKGFEGDLDGVIKSLEEYRDVIKANPLLEPIFGQRLDQHIAQLKLQRQGVDDGTNALRQYGPTLQSGGALLDKYGESVDKSNLKQEQQTQIIEGQKPVWQHLVEDITGAVGSLTGFAPAAEKAAQGTENFSAKAGAMASASAQVSLGVGQIETEVTKAVGGIDSYVSGIENATAASEPLNAALQRQVAELEKSTAAMQASLGTQDNAILKYTELANSIATHQTNIEKLNASLNTQEGQLLSYTNAVAAGNEKFLAWVQNTRDAADEAETFKSNLEGMASAFGGLPGFMEGTVEEYQAFIRANEEGGEAAEEFADMALESWRGLTSAAKPLFDDLKSTWADIFEGTTFDKATDAVEKANAKIKENFEQQQEDIRGVNEKMWENITSNAEGGGKKVVDVMDGVKTSTVGLFDGVDWEGLAAATTDPFIEAFNKLPMAVSDTLDNTERDALTFQAKFAQTAEMAGTAWATNLQANMSQGFDQALSKANQAAADVLAPFIQQHPETAEMFQPLFDAMNQTGPGAAQAVQDVLEEMSGMPGPVGDVAKEMLGNYQTEFGDKLPGVTKGGMEGALSDLTRIVSEGFDKLIQAINGKLDNDIKQTKKPKVDVDSSGVEMSMKNIQSNIDQVRDKTVRVTADTSTVAGAISTATASVNGLPATKAITITADASAATGAISGVTTAVNGIPASKNISITADATAAVGAASSATASISAIPDKTVSITADASGALGASASVTTSINSISQTNIPGINANDRPGVEASGRVQGGIDNIRQNQVPTVNVDTSEAERKINALFSAIARLGAASSGYAGVSLSGTGYSGNYPGQAYPGMNYAKGFGPAIVNQPMRMLVGEAGPELVSVIPMKGNRQWPQAGKQQYQPTKTAAGGFGGMSYWYGGTMGPIGDDPNWSPQQMQQGAEQGTMQGSQQGTEQGMQQSQPGMEQAVQQGAMQGTQQGYQQVESRIQQALLAGNMAEAMVGFGHGYGFNWSGGAMGTGLGLPGGGGAQYPTAPSNTEIWGAGRFTWGGGASGTQLGGGNMGGAQYPTAGVPLGPEHAIGFGSRPIKYTWGGGASGMTLTPHGPHVGEGLPGPDPHAFGGTSRGVLGQSYGGSTMGAGYRMPGYEGTSDAEYERRLLAERDRIAQERGTSMGSGASKNFVKAFDAGVQGQSQLINGVPATILSGNGGPARQAGNEAGTAAGQGFAQGFNDQMGSINTSAITQGQAGYPKAYTGEVPASYGKPLGQLINGIAATILPGQGPRGPPMQAAFGMHRKLSRDTLIQAHRNERVDISPGANAAETAGKASEYANAAIDRITALLEKLLSQGNTFKVDFNVDGRKLSSVAAKHMGTTGYGDK